MTEFTGRTVEEAIETGLTTLSLSRDQVEIEILEEGRTGVFGMGSRLATVRITLPGSESAPPASEAVDVIEVVDSSPDAITPKPTPVSETMTEMPTQIADTDNTEGAVASVGTTDSVIDVAVEMTEQDEVLAIAQDFLQNMLDRMGLKTRVEASVVAADKENREPTYLLNIEGEDLGILIGRRAETLEAIQYLVRLVVNRYLHTWPRIEVDVEHYKERRELSLERLANTMADKAVRENRTVVLEAMPLASGVWCTSLFGIAKMCTPRASEKAKTAKSASFPPRTFLYCGHAVLHNLIHGPLGICRRSVFLSPALTGLHPPFYGMNGAADDWLKRLCVAYNDAVSAITENLARPRIGLLATLLSTSQNYRSAGLNTYSHQLLHHLPERCKQFEFLTYVGDASYRARPGLLLRQPRIPTQRPIARIFWEQARLPQAIRRDRLSLLHGLAYATPLFAGIPIVVTVHDLSFLLYPQSFRPGNRLYLSRITAQSCHRARRVIAVSKATANDLVHLLGVPETKIDVVYNGVDEIYSPLPVAEVEAYRRQAGWPESFMLIVGTLEPRKNHLGLLDAYDRYRRSVQNPIPLLIGGGKGWYFENVFERVKALGLEQYVHFLGFVPLTDLPWLYNAASLFVYPSVYEGFGLPVAEAMACGTPVITSSVSSLPEVAGDAAWMVDPDDSEALALAMTAVLNDSERSDAMRTAGLTHAAQFRWTATADATAAVYAHALEKDHG